MPVSLLPFFMLSLSVIWDYLKISIINMLNSVCIQSYNLPKFIIWKFSFCVCRLCDKQNGLTWITNPLKIFLTDSLEAGRIQRDGHFSGPLFMRNAELKMQEAMWLFIYVLFHMLFPTLEILLYQTKLWEKQTLYKYQQNIKEHY